MGVLKIDCYCNEQQMEAVLDIVYKHICACVSDEMDDIDQPIDDMRICVVFDVCLGRLSIISSEILNSDWDVLYEDTAVLTSRLRSIISHCNRRNDESAKQAREIQNDQCAGFMRI